MASREVQRDRGGLRELILTKEFHSEFLSTCIYSRENSVEIFMTGNI